MSKYYSISTREDALRYFVFAPTPEVALKVVENLTGPMNPSGRIITLLPVCPAGYAPVEAGSPPQFLEEAPDEG